jgi:hypothetical protein
VEDSYKVLNSNANSQLSAQFADLLPTNYGVFCQKGMGYGVLRTYGLWVANPREPSWWTRKVMGFGSLWVIKGMGYEGFDCNK